MRTSHSNQNITIGVIINPRKEEVLHYLKEIDNWLTETGKKIRVLVCPYESSYLPDAFKRIEICNEENLLKICCLLLTLGGDGTILRAVNVVGDLEIPIMGVNLGGLGFLADTPPEKMIDNLEAYIAGNYVKEDRVMLKCRVRNTDEVYYAFNDLVFDKSGFSRVIEIITHVDNNLLNYYIADGLIISTPTGSTGYSLSASGPIVIPQTKVFIINPICPHSLTNRPVVISDESVISLQVYTEYKEINFYKDGQFVCDYPSGVVFEVSKAKFVVKLIKMKGTTFYDTLRNKLHWGEDFRDKKRWSFKIKNQ
jgi:NAD+ kinase